jgi:hypothetical protein
VQPGYTVLDFAQGVELPLVVRHLHVYEGLEGRDRLVYVVLWGEFRSYAGILRASYSRLD